MKDKNNSASIQEMEEKNKILVGKIVAPQGLKGEFRVLTYTSKPEDFKNLKILDFDLKYIRKISNSLIICSSKSIQDRTEAEKLKNKQLFINKTDLPKLSNNEYYYDDLIGMQVIKDKNILGKVSAIYNFGAGDILEIDSKTMVSFIGAKVDLDKKTIII